MAGTAHTRPPIVDPKEVNQRILEKKGMAEPKPAAPAQAAPATPATPPAQPAAPAGNQVPAAPPAQPIQKTEPPKPETPPAFDVEAYNKAFGTQHKTQEEIKALYEAEKKWKEAEPKLKDYEKKVGELTLKTKENPFADEFSAKINEMRKAGATNSQIKAFVEISSIELDKLQPREKAILTYQLRDGLTPAKAEKLFNSQYKLNKSQYDSSLSDEEVGEAIEIQNIRLEQDARGIDSFLSEYKTKVSTVERPEDTFKKKWGEYEPNLKEITPVIANTYEVGKMPLYGKGEDAIEFEFPVPDDFRKAIPQIVQEYTLSEFAANRPVPLNQEGLKQIKEHLDSVLWAHFGKKLMVDATNHTASTITERMANKHSNGSKKEIHQPPQAEGKPTDSRDAYKAKQLAPRRTGLSVGS